MTGGIFVRPFGGERDTEIIGNPQNGKLREEISELIIQVQFSLLYQLENGGHGNHFGGRIKHVNVVWVHGFFLFIIREAKAVAVDGFMVLAYDTVPAGDFVICFQGIKIFCEFGKIHVDTS